MTEENTAIEKKSEFESLTAEEQKTLDDAVAFINSKINTAANNLARSLIEIGEYLIENFFEGDPKKAGDRSPRKGLSYRKLAEREDLDLSPTQLANAVKIAVQEKVFRKIGEPARLTDSHKVVLLSVPEDRKKLKYAKLVEKEGLSVRGLRQRLVDDGLLSARGRPRLEQGALRTALPVFSLTSFLQPFASLEEFSLNEIPIETLSEEDRRRTIETARKVRDKLNNLIEKLESDVAAE